MLERTAPGDPGDTLQVTGYVDRWSVRPGERVRLHVSCTESHYEARLVRLVHGDLNPRGPGEKNHAIAHPINGRHAGQLRTFPAGSCVVADRLPPVGAFTFATWICPTTPALGRDQGLYSWGDGRDRVQLVLDAQGRLSLQVRSGESSYVVHDGAVLRAHQWQFVAFSIAAARVELSRASRASPIPAAHLAQPLRWPHEAWTPTGPAVIGAAALERCGTATRPVGTFNGKLEAPLLFDRALTATEVASLRERGVAATVAAEALAHWDFVAEAHTARVPDRSGHARHAHTINRPLRLVPGHAFTGDTITPHEAPAQFNAVHLHDDDLADSGWEPSLEIAIPADLPSGIYAVKLHAGDTVDTVPFCVRAPAGRECALALLVPTVSYQVYCNIGMDPAILPPELRPLGNLAHAQSRAARYARANRLLSCYDLHSDGSGVAIASMLRPQLFATRPDDRSTFNDSPHQLGADLHLVDWLEAKGFEYDVITDHDLHREGAAALAPYRAVLSGTHAEYWTTPMRRALDAYTGGGGRFVYLSGNGLYWITALSDDGTIAEVRRPHGTRAWTAEPGAAYLSLTGELGGLWMHRGRAPQASVGVGFASQGFGPGRPYVRTPASRDPRYAFLFDGVTEDAIGDTPALVSAHGAAGYEVDRADVLLGTPQHAVVLASATGFSDCYQYVVENAVAMMPGLGGSTCPEVRADLVYFDTANGGAVFSTGSIAWCSTLSWNNYDNAVSRITENAIRAFLRPGPLTDDGDG